MKARVPAAVRLEVCLAPDHKWGLVSKDHTHDSRKINFLKSHVNEKYMLAKQRVKKVTHYLLPVCSQFVWKFSQVTQIKSYMCRPAGTCAISRRLGRQVVARQSCKYRTTTRAERLRAIHRREIAVSPLLWSDRSRSPSSRNGSLTGEAPRGTKLSRDIVKKTWIGPRVRTLHCRNPACSSANPPNTSYTLYTLYLFLYLLYTRIPQPWELGWELSSPLYTTVLISHRHSLYRKLYRGVVVPRYSFASLSGWGFFWEPPNFVIRKRGWGVSSLTLLAP